MNVSKVEDVGQMRSSSGTSMKTMRNELTLGTVRRRTRSQGAEDLHAEGSEYDHYAEVKEIRDSNCEAEEYAYYTGPARTGQPSSKASYHRSAKYPVRTKPPTSQSEDTVCRRGNKACPDRFGDVPQ